MQRRAPFAFNSYDGVWKERYAKNMQGRASFAFNSYDGVLQQSNSIQSTHLVFYFALMIITFATISDSELHSYLH